MEKQMVREAGRLARQQQKGQLPKKGTPKIKQWGGQSCRIYIMGAYEVSIDDGKARIGGGL